uniref:DNA recombination protein RmuC-like n=1 Tax=Stylophora pistillata TaxID=50429 RepID=A0A2B4R931_STYPI
MKLNIFIETSKKDTNEYIFVECLCKHLGIEVYKINCVGGFSSLKNKEMDFDEKNVKNIILFDADEDIKKRRKYIEDTLSKFKRKADIFLFPNNKDSGCFEKLLENIASDTKPLECFEKYEECLGDDYALPDIKAKMYSYVNVKGVDYETKIKKGAAVIGGVVGFFYGKNTAQKTKETLTKTTTQKELLEKENQTLKAEKQTIREKNETLLKENATLKNQLETNQENLKKQEETLKNTKETMQKEFENLANKIFEQRGENLKKQNSEQLDAILKPFKENIEGFEKTIKINYDSANKDRASLKTEIKQLLDLNQKMSEDANNLTKALKGDSKTQGDWGEAQLEVLLEKSGLEKDIHFKTQYSEKDEDGKEKRLDFVIDLPDGKNLIIDAKVSLTAYERYCSATDDTEKATFLKRHINSLKNHIKGLSDKNYQNLFGINAPDYVLMFVPIEPALYLGLQNDSTLFEEGFKKNIILVSSSTLMATMRTVSYVWKQENQKENVLEMARQCGALYDKFVGFTDDLIKVGNQMNTAQKTYQYSMNKLSRGAGNIVRRIENIKELGAETSKNINESLLKRADADSNLSE